LRGDNIGVSSLRGGRDDGGERFKRARKAYEVLSDAASRTLFDCQQKIASKELANILEVDIGVPPGSCCSTEHSVGILGFRGFGGGKA